ncbi:MAG TPA: hypothetical protein VF474_16410 [Phenylobacterium sp.]
MTGSPPLSDEPLSDEPLARTPCVLLLAAVCEVIAHTRCDLTTEVATQDGIQAALRGEEVGLAVEISREHRLGPGDRPDFLIDGRIVVEVKGRRHRGPAVLRQLERYAAHPQVEAIVLATSRAMTMPAQIGGKPVRVLNLGRAWL